MDAFECYAGNRPAKVAFFCRHDIDIFRADYDVNGFVRLKAVVYTFEFLSEDTDSVIGGHDTVQNIGLSDKVGDKRVCRLVIDIFRCPDLLDLPVIHDDNRIGHRQRFFLIMGDINESDPDFLLDPFQLVLHVLPETQVERAERFVQKKDFWPVDQGPCNCDPLLLAAGEGRDFPVFKSLQGDGL